MNEVWVDLLPLTTTNHRLRTYSMLKRLIEVALPLKEVSEQSAREKSIRHGHISTLAHLVGEPTACGVPGGGVCLTHSRSRRSRMPGVVPQAGEGTSRSKRVQAEKRRRLHGRGHTTEPLPGVHQASGEVGELEQSRVHRTRPQVDRSRPQDSASGGRWGSSEGTGPVRRWRCDPARGSATGL